MKTDKRDFSEKNPFGRFWAKMAQNGPKMRFLGFFKIASFVFSDFGPELEKFWVLGNDLCQSVSLLVCLFVRFLRIGSLVFSVVFFCMKLVGYKG